MAGVSRINMYPPISISGYYKEQPLTPATRAQLMALGVSTAGIRTEAQGQKKLHRAQDEEASKLRYAYHKGKVKTGHYVDENLKKARELADELNISFSEFENVTEIVTRIKSKLAQMKTRAKDDFDKNSYIGAYQDRLDLIELNERSDTNLLASTDIVASMNIAFHGLFQ
ncbi:MAG: hypothetical protein MJ180_05585 [Candidatus Gastranaerophilales bacterium]|nr:hypothetical protein [Candidatus Gastranaerophilales bacterium]